MLSSKNAHGITLAAALITRRRVRELTDLGYFPAGTYAMIGQYILYFYTNQFSLTDHSYSFLGSISGV